MTRKLAEQLRAWLSSRFGIDVPIVEQPVEGTCIALGAWGGGGFYSGSSNADELSLRAFARPDGAPLRIAFTVIVHEDSGQIDCWEATIDGALDEERAALSAIFDPKPVAHRLNDSITPTLRWNGVAGPL